ncbi:hypothetical protein ABIB25_005612 [Nakamurella sp. UYEF19]|uniref:hypothetical protein n=1 Tax=Nakamurella sp. UYEF19 TaxID=1756392 RepID=UPI00339B7544
MTLFVQVRRHRIGARRQRLVGLALALALTSSTLAACQVTAGSAVVIDGAGISEAAVQADTGAFVAANVPTGATTAQVSALNRAQITFAVRHALLAKAIAAGQISVTDAQINAAAAQAGQSTSKLATQLELPASEEDAVLHDVVALQALVQAIPAQGVQVGNISVTAEGVPAATRDQAVALRSEYLADPAKMDAVVAAAGTGVIPRAVYTLLTKPAVGAAGLFGATSGSVFIVPNSDAYLVLRATGRSVSAGTLGQAEFSSVSGLSDAFDLGVLLLGKYVSSTSISVNPRYGVWDPGTLQVIPGNDGL